MLEVIEIYGICSHISWVLYFSLYYISAYKSICIVVISYINHQRKTSHGPACGYVLYVYKTIIYNPTLSQETWNDWRHRFVFLICGMHKLAQTWTGVWEQSWIYFWEKIGIFSIIDANLCVYICSTCIFMYIIMYGWWKGEGNIYWSGFRDPAPNIWHNSDQLVGYWTLLPSQVSKPDIRGPYVLSFFHPQLLSIWQIRYHVRKISMPTNKNALTLWRQKLMYQNMNLSVFWNIYVYNFLWFYTYI